MMDIRRGLRVRNRANPDETGVVTISYRRGSPKVEVAKADRIEDVTPDTPRVEVWPDEIEEID